MIADRVFKSHTNTEKSRVNDLVSKLLRIYNIYESLLECIGYSSFYFDWEPLNMHLPNCYLHYLHRQWEF